MPRERTERRGLFSSCADACRLDWRSPGGLMFAHWRGSSSIACHPLWQTETHPREARPYCRHVLHICESGQEVHQVHNSEDMATAPWPTLPSCPQMSHRHNGLWMKVKDLALS